MAEQFFLFLASTLVESASSKLKATGIRYEHKRLDSKPENWQVIAQRLVDPDLSGVVARLSPTTFALFADARYQSVGREMLAALQGVKHVVYLHEHILTGEGNDQESTAAEMNRAPDVDGADGADIDSNEATYVGYYIATRWAGALNDETRNIVQALLEEYGINVVPYRTNAELSVLAAAFIDDSERNLLFRVYVPSSRLYASEADRLLGLFRDWLVQMKAAGIRQDEYSTAAGHVYEFFGDTSLSSDLLGRHFDDFSRFLDNCVADPSAAEVVLVRRGLEAHNASLLVQRYGKEARRLHTDVRQERERRVLALKHRFESELEELGELASFEGTLDSLIEAAVPKSVSSLLGGDGGAPVSPPPAITVNYNPQIVHAIRSVVLRDVQGTLTFGPEASELLALIAAHGGAQTTELQSAVHELEDADARTSDRLVAKQRLKMFLIRVGGGLERASLAVLQKYIESKIGL